MNKILSFSLLLCLFCSPGAVAQKKEHLNGRMEPELLTRLHAEHAQYLKENKIDLSAGPSTFTTNAYFLERARNKTDMLQVLNTITREPQLFQQLELVGDQESKVHQIVEEYRELLIEHQRILEQQPKGSHSAQIYEFNRALEKLTHRLADCLVGFQTFELMDATLGGQGLLDALTQPTLAAKYVNLSEQQKQKIKEKQSQLGNEVIEFIRQKRKESSLIFEEELDKEQKRRVVELFGAEKISTSFEQASSTSLIIQAGLNPHEKEAVGPKLKAWRKIEKDQRDQ